VKETKGLETEEEMITQEMITDQETTKTNTGQRKAETNTTQETIEKEDQTETISLQLNITREDHTKPMNSTIQTGPTVEADHTELRAEIKVNMNDRRKRDPRRVIETNLPKEEETTQKKNLPKKLRLKLPRKKPKNRVRANSLKENE